MLEKFQDSVRDRLDYAMFAIYQVEVIRKAENALYGASVAMRLKAKKAGRRLAALLTMNGKYQNSEERILAVLDSARLGLEMVDRRLSEWRGRFERDGNVLLMPDDEHVAAVKRERLFQKNRKRAKKAFSSDVHMNIGTSHSAPLDVDFFFSVRNSQRITWWPDEFRIERVGPNFREWFGGQIIQPPSEESHFRYVYPAQPMSLTEISDLIQKKHKGEYGLSLYDVFRAMHAGFVESAYFSTVFICLDKKGVDRAVVFSYGPVGLRIEAYDMADSISFDEQDVIMFRRQDPKVKTKTKK